MSDSNTSDDALVDFDQTNGEASGLDGESDGTVAGEDYSDADRGPSIADQDDYVAETLQDEEGDDSRADQPDVDPVSNVASVNDVGGFHTGD